MVTAPSRGEPLSSVLVDACGWIALVDARLNLDSAMAAVAGAPRLIVLDAVQAELDRVAGQRGGMLLDLLARRSESMADLDGLRHSDDMLVELSGSNGWPVLTVDRRLKERLIGAGGSYIEVTAQRILRHVQS